MDHRKSREPADPRPQPVDRRTKPVVVSHDERRGRRITAHDAIDAPHVGRHRHVECFPRELVAATHEPDGVAACRREFDAMHRKTFPAAIEHGRKFATHEYVEFRVYLRGVKEVLPQRAQPIGRRFGHHAGATDDVG